MSWFDRRSNFTPRDNDARTPGDIDYGRIIHSASFRRLQGKTQILSIGDSDFYRTRLTHSLEVAQIATGLVRQLGQTHPRHEAVHHLPCQSMILAISSAHDLGHPPFGHGGEVALNYCMRDKGGFEGNGQTLRILTRLETFSEQDGADLTRRSLLGVLKYPASLPSLANPAIRPALKAGTSVFQTLDVEACKPPKGYLKSEQDVVDWILRDLSAADRQEFIATKPGKTHAKTIHKSLDCSLMDIADDISYGIHDFEDALAMGLVRPERLRAAVPEALWDPFLDARRSSGPASGNDRYSELVGRLFGPAGDRKKVINALVGFFINAICFSELEFFTEPLLRWRVSLPPAQASLLSALKDFVMADVIRSPSVQHLEFKGQQMVVAVFEALQSDPERLLPLDVQTRYAAEGDDMRVICDHVAAMTDGHLMKTYERLFSPRMGSVFDRI